VIEDMRDHTPASKKMTEEQIDLLNEYTNYYNAAALYRREGDASRAEFYAQLADEVEAELQAQGLA
jgi:hypothetical protein